MHKVIETSDNQHIGALIDLNSSFIILDQMIFKIEKLTYKDDKIELTDGDYRVTVVLENNL
jgi:hypothetical protein